MKKVWLIGGIVGALCLIVLVFGALLWKPVKDTIAPQYPEPVIVSSFSDHQSGSLFDASMRVVADIRNDGIAGEVVFEATVYQGENQWTKTKKELFTAKETKKLELSFDEVTLLGGEQTFSVKTYPLK